MENLKEFGKKLVDNAFAGKSGHRIAIIGQEVFGDIKKEDFLSENYSTSIYFAEDFLRRERLVNFTLCIVGYDAFIKEQTQSIFFKQFLEALESGVNFCFVFDKEPHKISRGGNNRCLGFQVLNHFKTAEPEITGLLHEGKIKKQEFRPFLKRWGSTRFWFHKLVDEATSIYMSESDLVLGFSFQAINGNISYLPFAGNHLNKEDLKIGIETLIDNLLTYLGKSRTDLPDWAKENSFFSDEEDLLSERKSLTEKLATLEISLQMFDEAKSLMFHNEHNLEITLPNFLKTHLGLQIEQNETFKEDFWIIDKTGKRKAISEIKTKTKGFTKGLVHFILAHKENYELEDDFPALLFTNCNLQAGNWKDKDKFLNIEDCKYAKNHNVLIIRIEDVVRLWEKKRLKEITSDEILNLFLTQKGWLHVTSDLKIDVKPK